MVKTDQVGKLLAHGLQQERTASLCSVSSWSD